MHRDIVACLQTTVVPEIEQMMASQANVIAAYKAAFISQHKIAIKETKWIQSFYLHELFHGVNAIVISTINKLESSLYKLDTQPQCILSSS